MLGCTAWRTPIRKLTATVLMILILMEVVTTSVYATAANTTSVGVSPGKYDLKLGDDFPTFGSVKLSYPDSAILTNSTGDLLFSVNLNPLMLNFTSSQVGLLISFWGSGFSPSDTSCTVSGTPVGAPSSCTISNGIATGSFVVAKVPASSYTITVTGIPTGDHSATTFTVLPPLLALNPSSGPTLTSVAVTGSGFFTNDNPCTLTFGSTVFSCSIIGNTLSASFSVPAVAAGPYAVTAAGKSPGDSAGTTFQVSPQQITLTPGSSSFGSSLPVTVSGSGFSHADTGCTLTGNIIAPGTASCTIGPPGTLSGSFTERQVPAGVSTVVAIGTGGASPESATANFLVFPSLSPPETPISATISIDIYIPPDFSAITLSQTWTSFTNNYDQSSIRVSRQSSFDSIGPNWWRVTVSNITVTHSPASYSTPLVAHRIFIVNQTEYIRLFQVASPTTAGRYFFKAFINGVSIGAQNFPTLVVKASRDPAYISGVLREWGDRNFTAVGQPINLAYGTGARVVATGYDYLGRAVSAQAFVNSTAGGDYTLFGVAPGTYNITAYAAGYQPAYRPGTVSVLAAQSLEDVDIFMSESVMITGIVLSTCYGSPIPWGTLTAFNFGGRGTSIVPRAISVQVLNLDGTVAAQTPINSTFTIPAATQFNFTIQRFVGLDGRIPQDFANYTSGLTWGDYLLRAYVASYVQLVEVRVHVLNSTTDAQAQIPLVRTGQFFVTVHFRDSNSTIAETPTAEGGELTVSAYDQEGILRAQNSSQVPAGSKSASIALLGFSSTRTFGTGSLLPTNYGLLPGTYHIVARFTAGQLFFGGTGGTTNAAGDLYFQLNDMEATIGLACDANVSISFSIYLAGGLLLSIYPVTYQTPPVFENYWAYPNSTVRVTMESEYGGVYQGSTTQPILSQISNMTIGPAAGRRYLNFSFQGLLPGTYVVYVQTLGYTQTQLVNVGVRLGANSDVSVYMIKNPVIDLTVAFRDENILTTIDSKLPFAQPINNIDATPTRIEVFDDRGNFVAANATYIGNGNSTFHFRLAGFDRYEGDPRNIYAGFYDTTDGSTQIPGGLILYPWSFSPRTFIIRIWIDGYYQLTPLEVTIRPPQNVSVVTLVDRSSRIYGSVLGPDFFDQARHLSWATITLEPNNHTLTNIIDVRPGNYSTSSLDGDFQVWVPHGDYGMGVTLAGYASYQTFISVPAGSDMNMQIWLDNYQASSSQYSLAVQFSLNSVGCPSGLQQWPRRNS